ncbi:TetR/AcrR family transcriptional regulator [Serinibacter salmoneus]|uniref:TetR family transcriptional regulator n=1 Tax=Serinibacter salmoneus TaxID=556530 RepID=A0A2A9CYF6_9MICO|nr:TetR/AcrR family transcriptional regulator [Serinibacter salmoneus]PFG18619.1 TetR family transcriptional regulator [Serinibacter salmoneus]
MTSDSEGTGAPRKTSRGSTGGSIERGDGLPDGRRVRGEARRRLILNTAVDVFGEQGFRGSSLREIARRVGISEAGLLHHFGSKAALLSATIEERDRRDRERRAENEAAGATFTETMRAQVARNAAAPGLVGLHVVVSAEATDPSHPAHEVFRERYRSLRHQDDELFRACIDSGALREDVDPTAMGQIASAVMDGLQLQWLLDPDNVDMVALFDQFLALLTVPQPADPTPLAPPETS